MKVDEKKLGCKNCRYRNGNVCDICYKKVCENFKERTEKTNGKASYDLYIAEKNGEWTKDSIIRRDIDECILKTTSPKAFYREMQKLGYSFKTR